MVRRRAVEQVFILGPARIFRVLVVMVPFGSCGLVISGNSQALLWM